ncbi:hypothetical protein ACE7GA_11385 [Roseomonas sp. CCTCC AB2023176]|uniref:hypothetical protein n=1 Tax=Roseomonas sp. CCTCC AB2023176 TaxID=3342640 RepID=UPI0035E3643D
MLQATATGNARRRRHAVPALLLLALAGCSASAGDQTWWNPLGLAPAPTSPPPATGVVLPVRAADPVAAFAGRAQIGQQESVPVPDSGRLVTARLARTYQAASGRECREVQFSAGGGAIYCNDPSAGWVAARPLLRGGAVARP